MRMLQLLVLVDRRSCPTAERCQKPSASKKINIYNTIYAISQKPRRTPKPTPQRLAAEEEQAARRLAKANQATPKSAKAKVLLTERKMT